MDEIRNVRIDELQPTEFSLRNGSRKFYSQTFPLLREIPLPEVWELDGVLVISDGHNQLYDRMIRGNSHMHVRYLTPKNCGIGKNAYAYVVEELTKCAAKARERGIQRISDLSFEM
ncbi:MAG: hypothetical protein RL557_894 [archaeon]|jgi:hypothetical protein